MGEDTQDLMSKVQAEQVDVIEATTKQPYDEREERLQKAITEQSKKHSDLWHFRTENHDFLLRAPEPKKVDRCLGHIADSPKNSPVYLAELAYHAVVWPDANALKGIFERQRMLAVDLANDALNISGEKEPDRARKL